MKTKEQKKLILQCKENKNGQKRVTIPKGSEIKHDDYVEVNKLKMESQSGCYTQEMEE